MSDPLPTVLPSNPLPLVGQLARRGGAHVRTASTMALATIDPDGRPSARMVDLQGLRRGRGLARLLLRSPESQGA